MINTSLTEKRRRQKITDMRAIKINVVDKTVSEIQIQDSFKGMCVALKSNGYDAVRLSATECLWVDDEGLLKEKPLGAFRIEGYPQALSGHGIIIGLRGPANVDTKLDVDVVRELITFVDSEELPEPLIKAYSLTDEQFKEWMETGRIS